MVLRKCLTAVVLSLICLLPVQVMATPKVGDMALDFNLKEVGGEGKNYSLSDFKGKVTLLNLWAAWCNGCKEEMPHFIDLQQSFGKEKFIIVAVSIDRNEEDTVEFLSNLEKIAGKKVNFLVLIDEEKKIARDYNPFGLPTTYLIDGSGKIAKIFYGSLKESAINKLKNDVEALLKEK